MRKSEESLCNLWDTIKRSNLWNIVVTEEERERKVRKVFKRNNGWELPNLEKDLDMSSSWTSYVTKQTQKDLRDTQQQNCQKIKTKKGTLKVAREKKLVEFSSENISLWNYEFQIMNSISIIVTGQL